MDTPIDIGVDTRRLHFFDLDTGLAQRGRRAARPDRTPRVPPHVRLPCDRRRRRRKALSTYLGPLVDPDHARTLRPLDAVGRPNAGVGAQSQSSRKPTSSIRRAGRGPPPVRRRSRGRPPPAPRRASSSRRAHGSDVRWVGRARQRRAVRSRAGASGSPPASGPPRNRVSWVTTASSTTRSRRSRSAVSDSISDSRSRTSKSLRTCRPAGRRAARGSWSASIQPSRPSPRLRITRQA